MSKRKNPKSPDRKTFKLPASGPLYDDMDDIVVGSSGFPDGQDSSLAFDKRSSEAEFQPFSDQQVQALHSMLGTDRLISRSLRTISVTMLFFAVAGAAAGWLLAVLSPNFFRFAFDAIDRIDFQAWEIGLGYGTVFGALLGLIAGSVAVLATSLYQSRMIKRLSS